MGNMILCCGLSGSGKTTFCQKFIEKRPDYIHLNVDDFYRTYNGAQVHENEFEVWISYFNAIHSAALSGKNVIIDTNALDAIDRAQFVRWFPEFEYHYLYWVHTNDSLAWNNNLNRSRVIPWEQWIKMRENISKPTTKTDKEWDEIVYIENVNNTRAYKVTKPEE